MIVVVGDREIEIDEKVLEVLRKYKRTEMTLEQLAASLGLSSWEEAYELVKKVPAWLLDVEPVMWRTVFKRESSSRPTS